MPPLNSAEPNGFRRPPAVKTNGFLKEFEGFRQKSLNSIRSSMNSLGSGGHRMQKPMNSLRKSKVFGPWCMWKGGPELRSADRITPQNHANSGGHRLWKNPGRAILVAEKPWVGYFGRGKAQGGLFWPRQTPGRAILAAEKPRVGDFGRGKTLGGLVWPRKTWPGVIWAAEKPCARAHSGNLTYRLCSIGT